ncbi:hypothetical protein [Microbaculum marinum]|uniref:Uncharacterized protein n=1 Tax=Microbaculum marinum TaxID=1764581 RepID=A0AAW9RPS6_9HYPH
MWSWLQEHSGAVSALASIATLLVWAVYLDLILRSYRSNNRPKILINFGGSKLDTATCLVANMSAQAVYMDSVVVTLHVGEHSYTTVLSEQDLALTERLDQRAERLQGPLKTGEHVDIGQFRQLAARVAKDVPHGEATFDLADRAERMDILVVGVFTGADRLIAAQRSFDLVGAGDQRRIRPRSFAAEQIRSGRRRRQIERFMLDRHEARAAATADPDTDAAG